MEVNKDEQIILKTQADDAEKFLKANLSYQDLIDEVDKHDVNHFALLLIQISRMLNELNENVGVLVERGNDDGDGS